MNPVLQTCLVCCTLATFSACILADTDAGISAATELARRPVIDPVKLEDMRGGLSIAGLDYSVGAVMRTLVDGNVVLESSVDLSSMTGADVTDNFVLQDSKGITQVTHDLNENHITAVVVNEANQRQIQVELDINVTLHNFDAVQAASMRNRILDSLGGFISP